MQDAEVERRRLTVALWEELPESKLELIGGRLIAGNSLAGSWQLLWAILQGLGPRAALPFAPPDRWRAALAAAFHVPPALHWPHDWQTWAAQVTHMPVVPATGPHFDWRHHRAYSLLLLGLYQALREGEGAPLGRSIQRFVLRLGADGFMPDLQVFRRDRLHRLQSYYFDGPADLVIEVVLPGHAAQDQVVKRRLYAAGGVPEYWVIDPAARHVALLRLTTDGYVEHAPDVDGRYRSAVLPGLTLDLARLWACLDDPHERHALEDGIVTVEPTSAPIGLSTASHDREQWSWEWRPYTPPVDLRPTPISFAQFIDWCPEAKFELIDGQPHIGGWDGTRKVLGLLLMTFGLEAAVQLQHPRAWVTALLAEETEQRQDAARRDAWWGRARAAAALLRERFGVGRVVVVGDLLQPVPLHFWSEITLIVWGLPSYDYSVYQALCELPGEPPIEVCRVEEISAHQHAALAREGREIPI